ncbi:MAG: serine--tRNA ligase, partial [Thaumarchaeota archaeon]|nr:serine--tRNA ligase [Nitrososphaerota archaeon]
DIRIVREDPEIIRKMLEKRNSSFPLEDLIQKDKELRALMTRTQELKHDRNKASEDIAKKKKSGVESSKEIQEMRSLGREIESSNNQMDNLQKSVRGLLMELPNLPHSTVPDGKDESQNLTIRSVGKQSVPAFRAKDHIELGSDLGLIDIDRASKVSGSRFYYLKGDLVLLNQALIMYALEFLKERNFELIQPPYLLHRKIVEGCVTLSDFEDSIYQIEGQDLYLLPTSEHAIAGFHYDEILEGQNLPLAYSGVSPCFRKEAGTSGRDTKGIFRVHQFEKVEQFIFSKPENSWKQHEFLLKNAEDFFQSLGLAYRIVNVCIGDLGAVAAKKYDLEIWLAGQKKYREAVSCSNCTDYQARRLNIRFRDKQNDESSFVHTINSTLVATERALIGIMENYQTKEGSISIPEVLRPYMSGSEEIN